MVGPLKGGNPFKQKNLSEPGRRELAEDSCFKKGALGQVSILKKALPFKETVNSLLAVPLFLTSYSETLLLITK